MGKYPIPNSGHFEQPDTLSKEYEEVRIKKRVKGKTR